MPSEARWIDPSGKAYDVPRDDDDESPLSHINWAIERNRKIVQASGVDIPDGPISYDDDSKYYIMMLARGWIRQVYPEAYALNKKYRQAAIDYVLMAYPKVRKVTFEYQNSARDLYSPSQRKSEEIDFDKGESVMKDLSTAIEEAINAISDGKGTDQALKESSVYYYYYLGQDMGPDDSPPAHQVANEAAAKSDTIQEIAPPGWEGTVKAMKRAKKAGRMPKKANMYALAWSMKNKGYKSHYKENDDPKWIQKAIKHPGALKKKAAAAGKSVSAFCKDKHHGTTGHQCALAKTLKKMHHESIYEEYVVRYTDKNDISLPFLSRADHDLAARVMARLSEAGRDPVRVKELCVKLLLPEQHIGD